mmetsp:Transcript_56930/g.120863  ORF Transcript_56930/g.120863 Transcript_56930/m.120863 type:complete len:292 (+) Transcript_56930:224-1099(+)
MPPSLPILLTSDSSSVDIPTSKLSTNNESDYKKLMYIQQALPDSTNAERQRFLKDRKGNTKATVSKLRNYLEWRKKHRNGDLNLDHLNSWSYATQMAIRNSSKEKNGEAKVIDGASALPCPLFTQDHTQSSISDKGEITIIKRKYCQHLPARIDTKLADTSTYALALALCIDRALDRHSTEKVSLVIDVRPGQGWANISAIQLLPFMQSTSRLLCDLFPLRLDSCIIFPVPQMATFIWKAVKPFVGTDTIEKVYMVTGPAGKNDKVPKKLEKYMDGGLIQEFEERRKSYFS